MSRIALGLFILVLSCAVSDFVAADSAAATIILKNQTSVVTPKRSSMSSTTIISTLNPDDKKSFESGDYWLELSVTDRRNDEFSLLLVIGRDPGIPLDSATILVGLENPAEFSFKFGDEIVSGTFSVARVIESSGN